MKIEMGIITALLTPLNEDESLDVESLGSLLDHVLAHDVKGIFLGGTVGEGNALRDRERARLLREGVRLVAGRVPVLANVSDTSTVRVLDNIGMASAAGVDAVVATPRMSFPSRTPDDTFRLMAVAAEASPVPLWFYENPATTPVTSDFELIARIMALPNVAALKFSAPDFDLFARCVRELPGNPPCFNGNVSQIFKSVQVGGGAISGIGSLLPGLCVRLYEEAKAANEAEADRLQNAISGVYSIYGGEGWPFWPTAQKHVLMRRGIIRTNTSSSPFKQLTREDEAIVDAALEQIEEWVFSPPVE